MWILSHGLISDTFKVVEYSLVNSTLFQKFRASSIRQKYFSVLLRMTNRNGHFISTYRFDASLIRIACSPYITESFFS